MLKNRTIRLESIAIITICVWLVGCCEPLALQDYRLRSRSVTFTLPITNGTDQALTLVPQPPGVAERLTISPRETRMISFRLQKEEALRAGDSHSLEVKPGSASYAVDAASIRPPGALSRLSDRSEPAVLLETADGAVWRCYLREHEGWFHTSNDRQLQPLVITGPPGEFPVILPPQAD